MSNLWHYQIKECAEYFLFNFPKGCVIASTGLTLNWPVSRPTRKNVQGRRCMRTDSVKKYVMPNIPYLFILRTCLKLGAVYRLVPGADFAHKRMGLGQSIVPAFVDFAPGFSLLAWLIGIVDTVDFHLPIYCKSKRQKNRRDEEPGASRRVAAPPVKCREGTLRQQSWAKSPLSRWEIISHLSAPVRNTQIVKLYIPHSLLNIIF